MSGKDVGIRWYDKVSNAVVNERTKLLIADRRHSLFGHICCLPENTPALQALQLSIEAHTGTPLVADWKRPPGRPRRNRLQQVEEDIGLSVDGPGSFDVEDATTLSWSSAAVSE